MPKRAEANDEEDADIVDFQGSDDGSVLEVSSVDGFSVIIKPAIEIDLDQHL